MAAKAEVVLKDGTKHIVLPDEDFLLDFTEENEEGLTQAANTRRRRNFFTEVRELFQTPDHEYDDDGNIVAQSIGGRVRGHLEGETDEGDYVFLPADSIDGVRVFD